MTIMLLFQIDNQHHHVKSEDRDNEQTIKVNDDHSINDESDDSSTEADIDLNKSGG